MIGPHHPHCLNQPVTILGEGCCCKGVVVRGEDVAVITDVIYHGAYKNVQWYSTRPVRTKPFVAYYRPQYRRLGG